MEAPFPDDDEDDEPVAHEDKVPDNYYLCSFIPVALGNDVVEVVQ